MTPEELKNSILQLAIQGKLVEQRPEEGTAEKLYQQVFFEKIQTEKLLSEISDDEKPFEIPENWLWVRLKNIAVLYNGRAYKQTELLDGGKYPVLRVGNLFTNNNWYYSNLELEEEKYCSSGDLLYSWSASFGPFIWNGERSIYHYHIWKIKYSQIVYREYLYYLLLADTDRIKRSGHGLAMIHITKSLTEERVIPIPPLAEQKRIVAKIEELLPHIDRYGQAWNKLEDFNKRFPTDMQRSILQMAIQGKLVDQRPEEGTGEELYHKIHAEKQQLIKAGELRRTKPPEPITIDVLPFDFPESWKVCYIDDIAFVTKLAGFEYTKHIAPNLSTTGIPLFKGKNVQNGNVVLDFESYIPAAVADELPRSQMRKKCLLTPYVGTIGNIAIFDGAFRAHLGSNVGKIELLNNTETYILEEYVLFYLRSTIGYSELTKYKKATAQESISIDAIRNVIVAIPPLAEQKRIVAKLEEILPLCENLI